MRHILFLLLWGVIFSCSKPGRSIPFTSVEVSTVYEDSLSIRAIEIMGNSLAFAANRGVFGSVDLTSGKVRTNVENFHTVIPEFRAVAHTANDFFMLSIGNPALLYKTGDGGKMDLVYMEEGEGVFYDAMTFWNDEEGIAIGDSMNGCLAVIVTRNGGNSWSKVPCSELPEAIMGEGAFAASKSNIKTIGANTWVATTAGRIYFSSDKGQHWQVVQTPIVNQGETEGIYAIDFYDEQIGFAIGGDYTKPEGNSANKALTEDGGKTWQLVADGKKPAYKSCVQFIPNSGGKGLVAVGFTGVSYSSDRGQTWTDLSEESFYTLRFLNDSTAYAAGKNRISKMIFR